MSLKVHFNSQLTKKSLFQSAGSGCEAQNTCGHRTRSQTTVPSKLRQKRN